MTDWILIGILLLIPAGAVLYLKRAKKCGQKCIGCPYANQCKKAEAE